MLAKLFGAALLFLCGALWEKKQKIRLDAQISELTTALELFKHIKNEISEYRSTIDSILCEKGLKGGLNGYLDALSPPLAQMLEPARRLGRSYEAENLRLCDSLIASLDASLSSLTKKYNEAIALNRLKAYAPPSILLILFL